MPKVNKEKLGAGYRIVKKHAAEYKAELVTLTLLGLVSAAGNALVPFIAGKFIDAILEPVVVFAGTVIAMALPWALLIAWGLIQTVTNVIDWQLSVRSVKLGNKTFFTYVSRGMGFLLMLPLRFHKRQKIGSMEQKFIMAANGLETIISNVLIDFLPKLLSVFVAIGIAYYLQPTLATILLFAVVIYIVILVFNIRPLAGLQRELWKRQSQAFGDAYDSVANVQAVKQATAENYEQNRMHNRFVGRSLVTATKLYNIWNDLSFYQKIIVVITQLLIFILAVGFVQDGSMTIGELVAFNAYAAMLFGPFVVLGQQWQQLQNGIINIYETEKIFDTPTEKYTPANAADIKKIRGDVSFENVSFRYGTKQLVLDDISFEAKQNETVALVGESGVGKSTLVDLISGYNFPGKGKIRIDGVDIRRVPLRTLRSHIAVVSQEIVLFNDTIRKNIKYGNFNATDEEVKAAARRAYAAEFIERFPNKWNQVVGDRGIKLSVGQKQRVAIARAILRDPSILILDEPTSALDAGTEAKIQESLKELMRGRTTFVIAHRLSTVRHADKILVFKSGTIVERGTHAELVEKKGGEYRRLYEMQIGLHE